jgi:hypothetical protein
MDVQERISRQVDVSDNEDGPGYHAETVGPQANYLKLIPQLSAPCLNACQFRVQICLGMIF